MGRLGIAIITTRILPYRVWKGLALRTAGAQPRSVAPRFQPDQIVRAIDSASRTIPGGDNCLARAIAGRALMAREGYRTELVLGVARSAEGGLKGHAWLRHEARTLLGLQGVDGFVPMPDLDGRL